MNWNSSPTWPAIMSSSLFSELSIPSSESSGDLGSGDEGGDSTELSAHAQAALQEFYSEQQAMLVGRRTADEAACTTVTEDWQLSQFWYNDETARILADEAIKASQNKRIACVSCPTLYAKLIEIQSPENHFILLEYDTRFQIYEDNFIHYDYKHPLNLPESLKEGSFDLVVVDPPFLSEECLSKTALTVKYLTKEKVILCTGAVMGELASELLGVKESGFTPRHQRNLANEFKCYINYNPVTNHFKNDSQ